MPLPIYATTRGSVEDMKLYETKLIAKGYLRVYFDLNQELGPKQYRIREEADNERFLDGGLRLTIVWREDDL